MKKNGFVFVETIVAIVILASALLLLYSSFHKILQSEKTRVNYDDISYVYRTWNIKKVLSDINIVPVFNDFEDRGFITIGEDYDLLFNGYENEKVFIHELLENYNVNQMILFKDNKKNDFEKCKMGDESSLCTSLYNEVSDDFARYIKSVSFDLDYISQYYILIEFNSNVEGKYFYSWVSV